MDDTAYSIHVVGGLLLGAALAAVVQLLLPATPAQPLAAFALAALAIAGVHLAEARRAPLAAEAGLAAALVAAASIPFYTDSPAPLGALAALAAVWVALVRRGTTPLALLVVPCFFVGVRHAATDDWLRGDALASEAAFALSLLALGALLVRQRSARWASRALALQAVAIALAVLPLLDALGVTDAGVAALAVAGALGAMFALGVRLGERPLVAVTGPLLACGGAAFAFLALGPALAALVLLCMGAALVWHAEHVRGYFREPAA